MAGIQRKERALILGATAVLPARLRVASRHAALSRWHLRIASRADVLFVRHPKTGGTWLRALITRLYARKYGLPSDRVVRYDELSSARAGLPSFLTSSGYLSWERPLVDRITSDATLRGKKLLFMPRHPIDVATSWYNQFTKRTSAMKREMLLAEMQSPIDRETIDRMTFVRHEEIGLPHVIRYHNLWWKLAQQHPSALVLSYEDLRGDTAGALRRLAEFLEEDFDDDTIADAVAFGSVDHMRGLERDGYFKNKSLSLRDGSDPDTLKVRRARVGGYLEDFTQEQARELEAMLAERLDPALGYKPS